MYKIIRSIHLYAALIISFFLLLFYLSGWGVISGETFKRNQFKESNYRVIINNNERESDLVDRIRSDYKIIGKAQLKTKENGSKVYRFKSPGKRAKIFLEQNADTAEVLVKTGGLPDVMNDLHRLHGYKGSWQRKLWAFFYDLSCLALVLFAISGIYLWWKLKKKKAIGWFMLGSSTLITLFTLLYMIQVL